MKKTVHPFALAALLAPSLLLADRISIDIGALASATNQFSSECNVATTNGWTIMGIDSYSDKTVNIRINRNVSDQHIDSPVFAHAITHIELKLKSSAQADRRLAFIPVYDGTATTDKSLWSLCDYSPNKDTYVARTNFFPISANVHAFRMALDDGKGSTGWGVSEMTIVTTDTDPISPPTNLQADNIRGTRCDLSWTNPENAVSNRIEVSEIVRKEEDGTMLDEYDFMAFTNTAKNASDCYDKNSLRMNVYSSFSGTNIYAAGNSTGVVQISSSDHQGYLQYDFSELRETLDKAANVSLILSAKKHPTDASGNWGLLITVATADGAAINATTNNLAEEFPATPFVIPLQNVTANEILVLEPSDDTKKNRRILIDYLAFIRDYCPAITSTNLVKTAFVTDSTTYSVRGLCPRTEYVARITAFDAEGNESSPSEPLAVTTNGEALPFSIRIQ